MTRFSVLGSRFLCERVPQLKLLRESHPVAIRAEHLCEESVMTARWLVCLCFFGQVSVAWGQGTPADYERAQGLRGRTQGKVFKTSVQATWDANGDKLWYRNDLPGGAREYARVDAVKGEKGPAFDHAKLAEALSEATKDEVQAERLPVDHLEFDAGGETVRLNVKDKGWRYNLQTHAVESCEAPKAPPPLTTII